MLDLSTEYTQTRGGPGPNIMPLLDVMLLLLIFFLLASVFIQPTLSVDLPQAANSTQDFSHHKQLTIVVTATGEIRVNDTPVPLPQLQDHLATAMAKNPDLPMLVRADKQSLFEHFVAVMDAVKGAGATELIIETRPSKNTGKDTGQDAGQDAGKDAG
jgi:biopolymer transport protein ExbD